VFEQLSEHTPVTRQLDQPTVIEFQAGAGMPLTVDQRYGERGG
jgi:hypothetical protein